MNKEEKLFDELKTAVTSTVPSPDNQTAGLMEGYSKRLGNAIINYCCDCGLPDPSEVQDGYVLVVRGGAYAFEPCPCPGSEPDSDESIMYPEAKLWSSSDSAISFSQSYEAPMGKSTLYNGQAPYAVNMYSPPSMQYAESSVRQVEIAYTLVALLKAPRRFEVELLINDKAYSVYYMTEASDPDDFVEAVQRVTVYAKDFGHIPISPGDLVKVVLNQSQYEVKDIAVSLKQG